MKGKLEFDLPEERESFELAVHASLAYGCIEDFRNYLRSKLKYEQLTDEQYHFYESVQDEFYNIFRDYLDKVN